MGKLSCLMDYMKEGVISTVAVIVFTFSAVGQANGLYYKKKSPALLFCIDPLILLTVICVLFVTCP